MPLLTVMLSPEAYCLNFANSHFHCSGVEEDAIFLDVIHFGCQAKEEMFYTHYCEGAVRKAVAILEFSIRINTSLCVCMIACNFFSPTRPTHL